MVLDHTLVGWLIGLLGVSLILGSLFSWLTWCGLRKFFDSIVSRKGWDVPEEENERVPIQPVLTGILERLFFTILIAFNIPGVAGGLFTWIVVKMVSGWNRMTGGNETWRRVLSFNALINSLVSLFFAVLGGLIANGNISLPTISIGELERDKVILLISIIFTLIGTIMVAFGYKVKEGISKELRKQLEIDKKDFILPSDIQQCPWLFYGGLVLILLSTLSQVLLIAGIF